MDKPEIEVRIRISGRMHCKWRTAITNKLDAFGSGIGAQEHNHWVMWRVQLRMWEPREGWPMNPFSSDSAGIRETHVELHLVWPSEVTLTMEETGIQPNVICWLKSVKDSGCDSWTLVPYGQIMLEFQENWKVRKESTQWIRKGQQEKSHLRKQEWYHPSINNGVSPHQLSWRTCFTACNLLLSLLIFMLPFLPSQNMQLRDILKTSLIMDCEQN